MATSGTIDEVQALLRAGRLADASRRLLAAAAADEPEAAATLAHWRIAGNVIRRDLPEARRLLGLAAAQGDMDSALLHAAFLASGVGGPDDWPDALELLRGLAREDLRARTQLERIEAMDIDPLGFPSRPPELRSICEAPEVYVSEAFMTKAECTYLREAGEPTLQRSVVVDPATGV
ncbi:MAG TPA: hypothetical protein VFO69_11215, partial [Allosphingosinicella sp.]|nr:hypothetical protein [Allosphingosinicella sp.]